jgi:hypothetical protein
MSTIPNQLGGHVHTTQCGNFRYLPHQLSALGSWLVRAHEILPFEETLHLCVVLNHHRVAERRRFL